MKRFLGIAFLCLFSSLGVQAQDSLAVAHLQKYWKYRARFLGQDGGIGFVKLGLTDGQSLCMSGRDPSANCKNDWHLKNQNCPTRSGAGKLRWGDATASHGQYLSILALEYHNLKRRRAETKAVLEELSLALEAFDRLDGNAELLFAKQPKLDGFFMRNDVPSDFYESFLPSPSSYESTTPRAAAVQFLCVESGTACEYEGCDSGTFISQDQVIILFLGLAFIEKFAREAVCPRTGMRFGHWAAAQADRITRFLIRNDWKIHCPDGERISNKWGGDVRAFNRRIAKMAERITDGRFQRSYRKGPNIWMGAILGSSFNWGFCLQHSVNRALIMVTAVVNEGWNMKQMERRARKSDMELFTLAYAVLNDQKLRKTNEPTYWQTYLNTAPEDGPCFGTPGCNAPDGWKSPNRFFFPGSKNGNPYGVKYEYPGLDYMLLYNLYHTYFHASLPAYHSSGK